MSEDKIVVRNIKWNEHPVIFQIFELNSPFFDASQKETLVDFLDKNRKNYNVIEVDGQVIGGGGYNISFTKTAFISWMLIHPHFQNKGFGSLMLKQFIFEIEKSKKALTIEALTSQHNPWFFQKFGFTLKDVRENFWGEGLHLHKMQKTLVFKKRKF